MPNGENGDYGEYGELEELRELVSDRGDEVQDIIFVDMGDGDGYANVKVDDEWFGFDLNDFDDRLWEELFDFIDQYDIDYNIYKE
jgi:hypothetical protein